MNFIPKRPNFKLKHIDHYYRKPMVSQNIFNSLTVNEYIFFMGLSTKKSYDYASCHGTDYETRIHLKPCTQGVRWKRTSLIAYVVQYD